MFSNSLLVSWVYTHPPGLKRHGLLAFQDKTQTLGHDHSPELQGPTVTMFLPILVWRSGRFSLLNFRSQVLFLNTCAVVQIRDDPLCVSAHLCSWTHNRMFWVIYVVTCNVSQHAVRRAHDSRQPGARRCKLWGHDTREASCSSHWLTNRRNPTPLALIDLKHASDGLQIVPWPVSGTNHFSNFPSWWVLTFFFCLVFFATINISMHMSFIYWPWNEGKVWILLSLLPGPWAASAT